MSVSVERNDAVTTVIMDRPEARNAVDPETAEALTDAFAAFDADPLASVAVFWGAGGAFCAGFDLKHASGGAEELDHLHFGKDGALVPQGPMGPSRMQLSKPVIAAVAGPAVAGGMELALWADMRVVEEDAYFGVYCRRWGVPLIDGGTVRLPRLVGMGRAMDLILTGRRVDADEALRIGLCERVVAKGRSRDEAEALAHEIVRGKVCRRPRQKRQLQRYLRKAGKTPMKNVNPISIASPASNYSHAVVSAPRPLVFVSGTLGMEPDGALPESIEEQLSLAWRNVEAILSEAGSGLDRIVRINGFLADRAHTPAYRKIRDGLVSHAPASTLVICDLIDPRWLVEIEVVAEAD